MSEVITYTCDLCYQELGKEEVSPAIRTTAFYRNVLVLDVCNFCRAEFETWRQSRPNKKPASGESNP